MSYEHTFFFVLWFINIINYRYKITGNASDIRDEVCNHLLQEMREAFETKYKLFVFGIELQSSDVKKHYNLLDFSNLCVVILCKLLFSRNFVE